MISINIYEKYKFNDFLLSNYERLLKIALNNYEFSNFFLLDKNKIIILRHDVEFSIPIALKMAEIENNLGIQSTYFVQLHSEFYNPFDIRNFNSLLKIKSLGHIIGLHFDAHF